MWLGVLVIFLAGMMDLAAAVRMACREPKARASNDDGGIKNKFSFEGLARAQVRNLVLNLM